MAKSVDDLIRIAEERNPGQKEFLQAATEILTSLKPVFERDSSYIGIAERLLEPERVISFRLVWESDDHVQHVNRGYRVQHSSALGPYKGGLRFHDSVNESVLKFLSLEQSLKNALTGQFLGSGKGGCDVNMRGRSDAEVRRICQAWMTEMSRHIGPSIDVPAGDIGVGAREVGFLYGQYRRMTGTAAMGVLTGKGPEWGGSFGRTEATGYGLVTMARLVLADLKDGAELEGKRVLVSGSGNVAIHAIEALVTNHGATVLTASDSDGTVLLPNGFDEEALQALKRHKLEQRRRLSEFADELPDHEVRYLEGKRPWGAVDKADLAMPCATQNELDKEDAEALVEAGVLGVFEGANMPCTPDAAQALEEGNVLYVVGKAANAGGVATSGLEMMQDAQRDRWTKENALQRLDDIMADIWRRVKQAMDKYDVCFAQAANIAGFVRVADAMMAQEGA